MRILVGTVEIGGVIPEFADGFRRLGHQVTTVVHQRNHFYPDIRYDVDINSDVVAWPDAVAQVKSYRLRSICKRVDRSAQRARLLWLIARHDVFVFQWAGTSLTVDNREYPLIKALGKRIVSIFNGDDVRHSSAYGQQYASLILNKSGVALQEIHEPYAKDPLVRPLRNLRQAERYSDLILSQPNQSGLATRPYMHFFVPVDLSKYEGKIPKREIPVVVHAPSVKGVKGTDTIMPVLERLRSEGVPFETRLLHGVPNHRVLFEMADADVVIDQLHFPLHGLFGIEAMASGCALATCNREEHEPIPHNRPIWHIDPGNLYSRLKQLLTDRELRIRLASEGRQHVERYHDHVWVARRTAHSLNSRSLETYDHYPTFFARSYNLPEGVVIPDDLKRVTALIVQRWGLPEGIDPQDMVRRGLMSADGLNRSKPIPRWRLSPSDINAVTV